MEKPIEWSVESDLRYRLATEVMQLGSVVETVETDTADLIAALNALRDNEPERFEAVMRGVGLGPGGDIPDGNGDLYCVARRVIPDE